MLVFDFGTEVYSWCGKLASMEQRRTGLKLAKLLHQSGYDYSECDINPMSPLLCKCFFFQIKVLDYIEKSPLIKK